LPASDVNIASFLTEMFDQAPTFMAVLQGADHRFQLANPSYLKLVGGRDVIGKTVSEALPEADAQGFVRILDEVYRTGKAYTAAGARFVVQSQPSGPTAERFLDFVYQPLVGPQGNVTGIFVQGSDTTERSLAERRLSESTALYKGLFDAIDEGFCIIEFFDGPHGPDSDYIHVEANAAYARHAGIPNVVGQKLREMVGAEADAWVERYGGVLRTGTPIRFQQELVATGRFLELAAIRIEPESKRQVAVLFQDITARRQAELALAKLNETLEQIVAERTQKLIAAEEALRHSQKMEAIGQLTGGVAHDFNNLLQVISGNLQLLAKDVVGDEKAERRIANAMTGVARGSKLASQLLAFGRRQPLEPKVVNLGRLVRGMDDMLSRTLGEGIEIETVVGGGLWNSLIDPTQVENALLNLAINARDAMNGSGKLTIDLANAHLDDSYAARHSDVAAGQYVMLAVSDTGSGMSAEVLAKAFDPFFSTKPEGRGTGLGLSMVYGFVKQSGGHVKIYSELDHGTTVRLYLPRSFQKEAVETVVDNSPIAGGTETVLVVEDDEQVRATVIELLTDLGYRVLRASDATSALHVVESGVPIDLLFTDVVMPGQLKSPELARLARERLPHLAVLFTSGYTENSIVHGGRLDVGVELLSKPYTREALARKIRLVLSSQKARSANMAEQAPTTSGSGAGPELAKPGTVLIVEDDALIRMNTCDILEDAGFSILEASSAEQALAILQDHPVEVLVTDVKLPGASGVELAHQAREQIGALCVVFATGDISKTGLHGEVVVPKPYSPSAIINAIERARRK
jgi:signal transduction histidine kinase/CheY-like chemotaxis protein